MDRVANMLDSLTAMGFVVVVQEPKEAMWERHLPSAPSILSGGSDPYDFSDHTYKWRMDFGVTRPGSHVHISGLDAGYGPPPKPVPEMTPRWIGWEAGTV